MESNIDQYWRYKTFRIFITPSVMAYESILNICLKKKKNK